MEKIKNKEKKIRRDNCPFCEQRTIITKLKDKDGEPYYICSKCEESFYNTKDFLTKNELKGDDNKCE